MNTYICIALYTPTLLYTLVPYILCCFCYLFHFSGTAVAQWLRCCVTNRKVTGSIPDSVIEIFH